MHFHNLSNPWQEVLHEVVMAYHADCYPIGAIIFDENLQVVARGRNAIHLHQDGQPVSKHELAHAEINALLQVSKFDFKNPEKFTLFTSLEPCLACFGAFVMSRVMGLQYGARDEFAGATDARDRCGYAEKRGNLIYGPVAEIEDFQIVLLTEFIGRVLPHDKVRILKAWRKTSPIAVAIGIDLSKNAAFRDANRGCSTEQLWNQIQELLDCCTNIKADIEEHPRRIAI